MHKKIEAELVSLAHQILQMKDKNDVVKLKNKAKEVYEKLAVLDFVNNYFLTTPQATEDKNEILAKIEKVKFTSKKENTTPKEQIAEPKEAIQNTPENQEDPKVAIEKINAQNQAILKAEAEKIAQRLIETEKKEAARLEKLRLEAMEAARKAAEIKTEKKEQKSFATNEDFKDSIPADVAANLFEKATKSQIKPQKATSNTIQTTIKKEPVAAPKKQEPSRSSVNDRVLKGKIQIGLNDRIAFVKHLFNFSQEEFNRVLSQLNSFTNEKDAKDFIINTVQTDYDWTGKEEYVERLFMLIERRFA